MTCAKQTVTCTIVTPRGERIVATNHCANPQTLCPRAPGEGYEKCETICKQRGHAEIQALRGQLFENLMGSTAYVEGHSYACDNCKVMLCLHGVARVVIGSPPEVRQ